MIVSADPNSSEFVIAWGAVQITQDGELLDQKDVLQARDGADGYVKLYQRSRAGQILTLDDKPLFEIVEGNVTIVIGNYKGCKPCQRNSLKRRQWWKVAHLAVK